MDGEEGVREEGRKGSGGKGGCRPDMASLRLKCTDIMET